jgi:hypothetical protein
MIVEKEIKDEELFFSLAGSDHLWHFVGSSIWMYKLSALKVLSFKHSGRRKSGGKGFGGQ